MKLRPSRISISLLIFVISGISIKARAAAPTSRPSQESATDVRKEVQDLHAQMEQMQVHQQELEKRLAEQDANAGPTNGADQNHQFFALSPITAGYDPARGFILASENGNYLLHPFLLLQARDVTNWRDNAKNDDKSSDTENGFEIRRMQIGFDGNVFIPDLTYRIFIQTDRTGGDASLFDAWLKYHFHDTPWYIEAGQFKTPFAHEQLIFDRTLLAADRTLTDDILADGEAFSQGAMAIYNNEVFRGRMDVTNGFGVNDVNFENVPTRSANFGVGARAEYKFMGQWKDYDQFTSLGNKQDLLVAGGGLDWTEGDPTDTIRQAADIQWNHGGLGLFGAYIGRYTAHNSPGRYTFDSSAVAQISYLLCDQHLEFFARYDYLRLDGKEFTVKTNSNVHEITLGGNYYFFGQNLKFTLDGTYLPNGSPVDDNGSGVLVNNGHGEAIARAQVQLAI